MCLVNGLKNFVLESKGKIYIWHPILRMSKQLLYEGSDEAVMDIVM